ncbi:hypothetical protein VTL71DRAFT_13167 [Oculimacula yallundae]|uniref:Dehydrin n=1 Tax=Oculimacula yallundae TaxID=86028 RepID=A0ABR4CPL1_9HELO
MQTTQGGLENNKTEKYPARHEEEDLEHNKMKEVGKPEPSTGDADDKDEETCQEQKASNMSSKIQVVICASLLHGIPRQVS